MRLVKSKKALLLIGSPMCAAYSQIQHINFGRMSPSEIEQVKKYGDKHLEFCAELYKVQHDNGLYFLHEHPFGASSWNNEKIQKLLALPEVRKVKSHMCAFGMIGEDNHGKALVKKPAGFMTNACKLADTLEKDCSGDHRHVVLIGGGRAKRAQVYPNELCRLRDQMIHDGRLGEGMIGAVDKIDEVNIDQEIYQGVEFYDDVSGKQLPKDETIKARLAEMKQVYAHNIYTKRPIQECCDKTGEGPVGTKWLEINKGDEDNLNIRARLVAQEYTKGN